MGAAWREPKDRDLDAVCAMVEGVKRVGLETCATLGMLTARAGARGSRRRGSTSTTTISTPRRNITARIITTRTYRRPARHAGNGARRPGSRSAAAASSAWAKAARTASACSSRSRRLPAHPESVPINLLVRVEGTPLADAAPLDALEFVRTIAVARITMPRSVVRLSAGREEMSDETQALCFLAGANSIFCGPRLLTTPNPARDRDRALFDRLGLEARRPA